MESYEILREAFEKIGPKQLSSKLGVSLSLVYKWSQPADSENGSSNPLDRAADLTRLTQHSGIIRWLCFKAGGFFVKNPTDKPVAYTDLSPATNEIIQHFADLLATVTTAARDRRISDGESADIRTQWDELKSFTEGFVRACEEGDFDLAQAAGVWQKKK